MRSIDVDVVEDGAHELTFRVCVREPRGETEHRVTLQRSDFDQLATKGEEPATFVRRCFEFLLERESKDSILRSFDIAIIGKYFPEFRNVIRT